MPTNALPCSTGDESIQPPSLVAQLRRERGNGINLMAVETRGGSEFHLTAVPTSDEPTSALIQRMGALLQVWEASVVRVIIFGANEGRTATLDLLRAVVKEPALPITWVEGVACDGGVIAGIQIHALAGVPVSNLTVGGRVVGRVWRDAVASHCVLGDLMPNRADLPRTEQAHELFETLQSALVQAGMTMKNLARTWLFLDHILSWYDDFNAVRTDFFARSGLRFGAYPASTGVNGRNVAGAAIAAAAWAVQPFDQAGKRFSMVPSPRQCPAPAYGSSFSRAVEIHSVGFRQLLVSGTASIAPDGRTANIGDVEAQIELTMQVVGDILESRGMSLADISRATAYFKSGADQKIFQDWLGAHELEDLPVVNAVCEICRDDLLFEIEVDAIRPGN